MNERDFAEMIRTVVEEDEIGLSRMCEDPEGINLLMKLRTWLLLYRIANTLETLSDAYYSLSRQWV